MTARSLNIKTTGTPQETRPINNQGNLRRLALLSSVSLGCLGITSPALADLCDQSGDPWVCSVPFGQAGDDINIQAASSTGDDGAAIQFTNGADFSFEFPLNNGEPGGWFIQSAGGPGKDDGDAGAGGWITIDNDQNLSGSVENITSFAALIYARSLGGAGDQDNKNNDSNGGKGGNAGYITITNNSISSLSASGASTGGFAAVYAESRGGQGGEQNDSVLSDQFGGQGGAGNSVTINNNSDVGEITLGDSDSRFNGLGTGGAILAKSLGGAGGFNNGPAGAGGAMKITNQSEIDIYWDVTASGGDGLFGLGAHSLGGDGQASSDDSDNGGAAGDGGTITEVSTGGDILLDVIGSGYSVSAAMAAKSEGGMGGAGPSKDQHGGDGGQGGAVTLALTNGTFGAPEIETHGDYVYGILAESLGGQGGNAADASALAGTGGGGGFGGNAGAVTVTTVENSQITTTGDYSAAIAVHSVGGGGGTGSDFQSVLGGQAGNGGNGGNAGNISVDNNGDISTAGQHAYGILGQSIAGSGGTGGVETGGYVALGGDGAGGGASGQVTLQNEGAIATTGYAAHGMVGQAIGGGGGAAGSASGLLSIGGDASGTTSSNGGIVKISNNADITTSGTAALGVLAQSIGGGGGSGADATGIVGVGGKGSAGGSGGAIALSQLGQITTTGDYGLGVVAHSVGGGGGSGGDALTISTVASIGIGGSAQGGGNGGNVCLYNTPDCPPSSSDATQFGSDANITTSGDYAPGVLAQSIGGGGGNGGSVKNFSVLSFFALQMGGNAGGGGSAGTVTVKQDQMDISTSGAHSYGLVAQAIGGGGGNGGSAAYADVTVGLNAAFILGGSGGNGGNGGASSTETSVAVDLTNSSIFTGDPTGADPASFAPDDAIGIVAQSIGGGGGNGGASTASDLVIAAPTGTGVPIAVNFQAAIGGNGGNGGYGATVDVSLTDGTSVTTLGDGAHGLLAQSIGGGGGNGGDSSTLSTTLGDKDTVEITAGVALGGGTGNVLSQFNSDYAFSTEGGGDGGDINLTLGDTGGSNSTQSFDSLQAPASTIRTYGDGANAVVAQSIGGGGGNGGVGNSNAYTQGGVANIKATLGLGGMGGSGGDGGEVDITHNLGHAIQTLGSGSRGVVAQSIGGGGGTSQGGTLYIGAGAEGYEGDLSVELGLKGGAGGAGGAITASEYGQIATIGGDADGVVLQSIGGGGGIGGSLGADASSHSILDRIADVENNIDRLTDEGNTYTLTVAVGGKGGSGGSGGDVDLTFGGWINTAGDWADGIVAQSISGGGGQGGSSTASGSKVQANIDVGVGGKGGTSDDAGDVTVFFDANHPNNITTNGYSAYGVLLQSIGGGGGQGGDGSDQAAGDLTVGGSAGGAGGSGGSGGAIQTPSGNDGSWLSLTTYGDESHGIVAQSIGGGGGAGGAGNSAAAKSPSSHNVNISVGGSGGVSGDGGEINMAFSGLFSTYGDRAHAYVAQSIGGGGGIGSTGSVDGIASLALGGQGGAAGSGGSVNVTLGSSSGISTSGQGSHGMVLQSIGGGGGFGGDASTGVLSLLPSGETAGGGANGDGGTINATLNGVIATNGANAFGILAQSIGGGGGFGGDQNGAYAGVTSSSGSSSGSGGAITINPNANITASGAGGVGIFAQSQGPSGNGVVTINIDEDSTITGGTGSNAAAIWVAGGVDNQVFATEGSRIAAGDSDAYAVIYNGTGTTDGGSTLYVHVDEMTGLSGNLKFTNADGDTAGAAINWTTTSVMSDATYYGANIINHGQLFVGSSGSIDVTQVTGDFTQGPTGNIEADIDMNNMDADHLNIAGSAQLDGTLSINAASLLPDRQVLVLSAAGGASGALTPEYSPLFGYNISNTGNEYHFSVTSADFSNAQLGLPRNQHGLTNALQNIWDAGGNEHFGQLFGALANGADQASGQLSSMISQLEPGASLAPAVEQQSEMLTFNNSLMSCPIFTGANAMVGESSCSWARLTGGVANHSRDGAAPGYSNDKLTYQFGAQNEVAPDWFLGFSAAYQQNWISDDDSAVKADGDSGFIGVSLKHEMGPWMIGGALSGGYGSFDMTRRISLPGYNELSSSNPDVYTGSARLRIARTFAFSDTYVKPYLDLDAIYTRMSGYRESGALGLDVEASDQFTFAASPTLEVGGRFELENGMTIRPYAYAGAVFLSDNNWDTTARFANAPGNASGFKASLPHEDIFARVGLGLQVSSFEGVDLRLEYEGEFSEKLSSNSGSLRVSIPF